MITTVSGTSVNVSTPFKLFIFARHGESAANAASVLSTDPPRSALLTEQGRAQARALGAQLANVPIDLAVCSRLPRTRETITLALDGRPVPILTEPGLDEIQAGDLDGKPIQAYWDWLAQHAAGEQLPHGESPHGALRRYADALHRLLAREMPVTLVVTHEFALRSIVQAAAPDFLPRPGADLANAVPYLFGEHAVRRAALGLTAWQDLPGGSRAEDTAAAHPSGP
jgi:broad specificity phosphatase PhoE